MTSRPLHDDEAARPVIVDERDTVSGSLVLRRVGTDFEIIHDGTFLMDTRNGESERRMVTAALDAVGNPTSILIGGLGVGFSLEVALASDELDRVVVVELHEAVVEWNRTHLGGRMGRVLDDARVDVVVGDVVDWIAGAAERFDAVCLDVDNGPDWLSVASNDRLYSRSGLTAITRILAPGGALAIWSASRSDRLAAELELCFGAVARIDIEVARGEPDVVYVARHPIDAGRGASPPGQSSSSSSTSSSASPT